MNAKPSLHNADLIALHGNPHLTIFVCETRAEKVVLALGWGTRATLLSSPTPAKAELLYSSRQPLR